MSDIDQDEIDKLLSEALGGGDDASAPDDSPPELPSTEEAADSGGSQDQGDIDALIADIAGGNLPESPEPEPAAEPEAEVSGTVSNQDDIDALLAGISNDESAAPGSADESADKPQDQDDIDALLAGIAGGDAPEAAAKEAPSGVADQGEIDALLAGMTGDAPAPAAASEPAPEKASGTADQDEIDALLAGMTGDSSETSKPEPPAPEPPKSEPEPAPENDLSGGAQDQSEIDALLAGMTGGDESEPAAVVEEAEPASAPEEDSSAQDQDGIDALLAGMQEDAAAPAEPSSQTADETNVDKRLSEVAIGESIAESVTESAPEATPPDPDQANVDSIFAELSDENSDELEAAQASVEDVESAAVVDKPDASAGSEMKNAQTKVWAKGDSPDDSAQVEAVEVSAAQPAADPEAVEDDMPSFAPDDSQIAASPLPVEPTPQTAAPLPARPAPPPPEMDAAVLEKLQESFSLEGSAGEVEGIAGNISSLLGQLAERARRYQAAWTASDQESRELRMQIQHLQHQNSLLSSEKDALAEEVDRLRNEISGVNLEARRARFEADRQREELESERLARARLQRAIESREKELHLLQARADGQASSVYLDELHRLARRLESDLDIRTSAAHEALASLEKLTVPAPQEGLLLNLRSALMTAAGITPGKDDTLGNLNRVGSESAALPPKDAALSFEMTIACYDFAAAREKALAEVRSGNATAEQLLTAICNCASLFRPGIMGYLPGLIDVLVTLSDLDAAATTGKGEGSSRVQVLLFDFMHKLARLKIVTPATADAWQFFIALRTKYFSFITSDRQWEEYREQALTTA